MQPMMGEKGRSGTHLLYVHSGKQFVMNIREKKPLSGHAELLGHLQLQQYPRVDKRPLERMRRHFVFLSVTDHVTSRQRRRKANILLGDIASSC